MFTRILVPLDGSENAEKVLPIVVAEAQNHQAVIVLVRVIAPLRQSLMTSPNLITKLFKELESIAKDSLEDVAEKIRAKGLEVEIIIERGQPAQRIHALAQLQSCNLIVIGTHGETGNPRWRLGNIANKIIRTQSPIPVLVITTQYPKQSG